MFPGNGSQLNRTDRSDLATVSEAVPPDSLLVYNIWEGSVLCQETPNAKTQAPKEPGGWEPICRFLGQPIPEEAEH